MAANRARTAGRWLPDRSIPGPPASGTSRAGTGRPRYPPEELRIPNNWSPAIRFGPRRPWSTPDTATGRNLNSYLVESVLPVRRKNLLTGRFELVDKDELFAGEPALEQFLDVTYGSTFRIGEYTIGYTRDIDLFRSVETGVGANLSAYSLPGAIKPYYGDHPVGGNIFVRFRLRSKQGS